MIQPKNKWLLNYIYLFYSINCVVFLIIGYPYLEKILESPSLFSNTFADFSSSSGKLLIIGFALVNYVSYLSILNFIPGIILTVTTRFYSSKMLVFIISIVGSSLSILILIIDSIVFSRYEFHLNQTVLDIVFQRYWRDIFELSNYELVTVLVVCSTIIIFELILGRIIWKNRFFFKKKFPAYTLVYVSFGGFLCSYVILLLSISANNNIFSQQIINLPLYKHIMSHLIPDHNAEDVIHRYSENNFSQRFFSNSPIHYPLHPLHCYKSALPLNIILVMVDSLRGDTINKTQMPKLAQFATKNWFFTNHISGGNATQPGLFSLFYSLPNNYSTAMLEQKIPPVINNLLMQNSYIIKILWASSMTPLPFDKTLFLNLGPVNTMGAPGHDVSNKDRFITQQAIEFLLAHKNSTAPFYLHLFYDAPHGYCKEQRFTQKYAPSQSNCSRINMNNSVDPVPYYNRYLNAVYFDDGEIAKLLHVIDKEGFLKNSIIIITADHGQEFNDNKHNFWEHASNFTRAQTHIPLIIHWPKKPPHQFDYVTSSYDVIPTLLKHHFNCHNPISDYSIGNDLLNPNSSLKFILSASYTNMGIIENDRLTTLRSSGDIHITDLNASQLPKAQPRTFIIDKAMILMRKYYY